jgi:hypothetical protein
MMQKILKIRPPMMPNFFQYEMPAGKKQDGIKFDHAIPIEELDEEEANEFAEMMKQEFLKHWRNRKQSKEEQQ